MAGPERSWEQRCLPNCFASGEEVELRRRSKGIDQMLARERPYLRRMVKILLLGAGESGKSTFLKQMRIIHGEDFDRSTLEEFRDTIHGNVVSGMRVLLDAREKLRLSWENPENEKHGLFLRASVGGEGHFQRVVPAIRALWDDQSIKEAYSRRSEFQLDIRNRPPPARPLNKMTVDLAMDSVLVHHRPTAGGDLCTCRRAREQDNTWSGVNQPI